MIPSFPSRDARLRELIATMRSDRPRFPVVFGGIEVVDARTVDEWADDLEQALAASEPPSLRDNGKPNRPHCFEEDPETGMCVVCGWAGETHTWAASEPPTPSEEPR